MRGYKILRQGAQWRYVLIPNNNNNQPVAQSAVYASEKECEEGVREFRKLVIANHVDSIDSPYITLEKQDTRISVCYVMDGRTILKAGSYENRQNCRKSIRAIFAHIDEYTLQRVFD